MRESGALHWEGRVVGWSRAVYIGGRVTVAKVSFIWISRLVESKSCQVPGGVCTTVQREADEMISSVSALVEQIMRS